MPIIHDGIAPASNGPATPSFGIAPIVVALDPSTLEEGTVLREAVRRALRERHDPSCRATGGFDNKL